MPQPVFWILEDEQPHRDKVGSIIKAVFHNAQIRDFEDASALISALDDGDRSDLIVVDLLVPAGDNGTQLSNLPGLDVIRRVRLVDSAWPVLIRTGLEDQIPDEIIDEWTRPCVKGSDPQLFVTLASSLLAMRGHSTSGALEMLTPSQAITAQPNWLRSATVLSGIAIAASLWVASVLQVVSSCTPGWNALFVGAGLVGGAVAGLSRVAGTRMSYVLLAFGLTAVLLAGLVLPGVGACDSNDAPGQPSPPSTVPSDTEDSLSNG